MASKYKAYGTAKKPIALVGMPGAGKSSVGRCLAQKLGLAFNDSDDCVEQSERMVIADIFARYGEARFRAAETSALKKLAELRGVISCGGGIVVTEQNRRILQQDCFTVYLCATADTLCERVGDGATRPLLQGDVRNKIDALYAARADLYAACNHCTVHVDGKTVERIADEIVAQCKTQNIL